MRRLRNLLFVLVFVASIASAFAPRALADGPCYGSQGYSTQFVNHEAPGFTCYGQADPRNFRVVEFRQHEPPIIGLNWIGEP